MAGFTAGDYHRVSGHNFLSWKQPDVAVSPVSPRQFPVLKISKRDQQKNVHE